MDNAFDLKIHGGLLILGGSIGVWVFLIINVHSFGHFEEIGNAATDSIHILVLARFD